MISAINTMMGSNKMIEGDKNNAIRSEEENKSKVCLMFKDAVKANTIISKNTIKNSIVRTVKIIDLVLVKS